MKKIILVAAFLIGLTMYSEAQTNDRAVGIRSGWGTEFSYQQPIGDFNRLEFDLGLYGWKEGDFVISGIYQWLLAPVGGFNLYAGFGGQVGNYWHSEENKRAFGLGVAGQLGVEYNFDIPLQISLDWRPNITIIPTDRGIGYQGVALGLRYRF